MTPTQQAYSRALDEGMKVIERDRLSLPLPTSRTTRRTVCPHSTKGAKDTAGAGIYRQPELLSEFEVVDGVKRYRPIVTAIENKKGVLDVDTVKGCSFGMKAYPNGGCYGECYACKGSRRSGVDFTTSITRRISTLHFKDTFFAVKNHRAQWYRIGVAGDPCHDWGNTIAVCEALFDAGKIPVIITKHWKPLTDSQITAFKDLGAVFNTSTSGMDIDKEIRDRVNQLIRLRDAGLSSLCRVVTCQYGDTAWGRCCKEKQDYLLSLKPVIDNPLRCSKNNSRALSGDIIIERREDSVGGGKYVSLHRPDVFLGTCSGCKDQCGVNEQGRKQ